MRKRLCRVGPFGPIVTRAAGLRCSRYPAVAVAPRGRVRQERQRGRSIRDTHEPDVRALVSRWPCSGDEIRALRRLQREQGPSSHVFMTERDGPMTPKAFHALFGRIGERAKMPFPVHPHMLRHGCGYALANAGHDSRALQAWLGHRNIQHTVRYTELAPDRFKNFWRD